mmetsp:Transcript_11105/g.10763  ORF Transcript_11105/g.10763 Transcript_11105/m.10763 type:complete len:113 (-) Transcript_11105:1161-1499(-)
MVVLVTETLWIKEEEEEDQEKEKQRNNSNNKQQQQQQQQYSFLVQYTNLLSQYYLYNNYPSYSFSFPFIHEEDGGSYGRPCVSSFFFFFGTTFVFFTLHFKTQEWMFDFPKE